MNADSDDTTDESPLEDMLRRGHSSRKFDPEEFRTAWRQTATHDDRADVRTALKRIDGGRFYHFLDAGHDVFAHYDLDSSEQFADDHPELMEWLQVFGMCEDLAQFTDYVDSLDEPVRPEAHTDD